MVELQFNGKKYGGWQKNSNTATVQGEVEKALSELFGTEITAQGCSRTDAGVSARQYFFHFDCDTKLPARRVCYKLNRFLPADIQAQNSFETDFSFHARKNVLNKTYVYRFYCGEHIKPLLNRDALFVKGNPDEETMSCACKAFEGKHNFAAFRTESSSKSSVFKNIRSAEILKTGDCYEFTVTGDGFLYNMVRIMAGAVIAAGCGKLSPEEIKAALSSGIRPGAALTLPPKALVLMSVEYPLTPFFEPSGKISGSAVDKTDYL